jgi:hypothetical protein
MLVHVCKKCSVGTKGGGFGTLGKAVLTKTGKIKNVYFDLTHMHRISNWSFPLMLFCSYLIANLGLGRTPSQTQKMTQPFLCVIELI